MAGGKVNKPMDTKQKDADVSRKLQLYGIFAGFQNGKVPSNDQVDVALNSFLASKALSAPPEALSSDGKALVADSRDVVLQAKNLLLSKNEGNLLQDFIWQTRQFDPKTISSPNSPVNKDTARKDGAEALEGLRTLGTLLITNGQFRKLLKDATILIRDMAGDAATNAAARVRPSADQLNQIDAPAEDNTWHEAPDLSKQNMKKSAQGIYGGNPKNDAKAVAKSDDPAGAARATAEQKANETGTAESKDKLKAKNDDYKRRAREYLKNKMPQERSDQAVWRLKKMVIECQQHPDYARAVQTLLDLAEQYGTHGRSMARDTKGTAKDTRSGFGAAEADLKTLIERFANGTSTDDLWSSIDQIYKDADRDEELKNWLKAMDRYVRRCLLEQGYILEDESTAEWDRLYDQGQYLLRQKYRAHTDRVIDEVRFLADQFDQDPMNRAFSQSIQKLFSHLGHDQTTGKSVFKPHLIKDVTEVILPAILESVAYVPIPRIEYSDAQFDAVIENLVVESDNLMPNVFEVYSENYVKLGRRVETSSHKQVLQVRVKGVQLDLRDINYYVRRKKGFPSVTDTGVCDIFLPGDGLSFQIKLKSADEKDKQKFFKIEKVDIEMKNLQVKFLKSKHKFLFSLFKPIVLKALRPLLQRATQGAIKQEFDRLDKFLWQVKEEADSAVIEVREEPGRAPNVYNRYMQAMRKRALEAKQKGREVTEVAKDRKVNMAITKEESIFPDVHLSGGISSRATEFRELARKGDHWESPVFSVGDAARSTDIPAAPKIEKKSHGPMNGAANTIGVGNSGTAGLEVNGLESGAGSSTAY